VRIVVRVTPAERAELDERAAAAGLSVQSYLVARGRAVGRPLPGLVVDELDAVQRLLLPIGRNLNQLARAANTGRFGEDVVGALAHLRLTLARLQAVLDALDPV
jgi:mobilization protein NikA